MNEGIPLLTDSRGVWLKGSWPEQLRLSETDVHYWRKPGTDDLLDIRVANGRAIYRVSMFLRYSQRFVCRLLYSEVT